MLYFCQEKNEDPYMLDDRTGQRFDLSEEVLEQIYRHVKYNHVISDIKLLCTKECYNLSDEEIELIAYQYVYEGKHDRTLNYWTQLRSLF